MKIMQDCVLIVKVFQPCNHDRENEFRDVLVFPLPLVPISED